MLDLECDGQKNFVKVLSEATIGKILLHGCKCGMDCFGSMTKVETEAKKNLLLAEGETLL